MSNDVRRLQHEIQLIDESIEFYQNRIGELKYQLSGAEQQVAYYENEKANRKEELDSIIFAPTPGCGL